MSHKTRAYIINAEGLKGFCKVGLGFINMLMHENSRPILDSICGWQHVNMKDLSTELRKKKNQQEMVTHLRDTVPGLAHFHASRVDKTLNMVKYFKQFKNQDPYSLYVHGYLFPALQ